MGLSEQRLAQARELQHDALNDERITNEQRDTLARLTHDGEANVSFAQYGPFDLPSGYLMVEVRGITYGIAPNGDASS
jgi:hypothetical protein